MNDSQQSRTNVEGSLKYTGASTSVTAHKKTPAQVIGTKRTSAIEYTPAAEVASRQSLRLTGTKHERTHP